MKRIVSAVRNYFANTSRTLWLICVLTSVFGAALVYSATRTGTGHQFRTQIIAIVLGYIAAVVISLIDYRFISKCWPVIGAVCIGLMGATSLWGKTVPGTDDKAWIMIGGISMQPSELVKIGFIVTLATHLTYLKRSGKLCQFWHICLLVVHVAIPMGIIHMQGDDGAVLVFGFIFLAMCFGAGVQLRYFLLTIIGAACAVPILWKFVLNPDQKIRFQLLLDHSLDPLGKGYQQSQGEISIGTGGLFGKGYLQGPRVAGSVVPEDHNDFIFTVAGEEFGFIGCVALIGLLVLMLITVMRIGLRSGDDLGRNICFGYFGMIAFQMIANIGMCMYIMPVIGITLPFFSAGGTSAACVYLGIGLAQSVASHPETENAYGMLAAERVTRKA